MNAQYLDISHALKIENDYVIIGNLWPIDENGDRENIRPYFLKIDENGDQLQNISYEELKWDGTSVGHDNMTSIASIP